VALVALAALAPAADLAGAPQPSTRSERAVLTDEAFQGIQKRLDAEGVSKELQALVSPGEIRYLDRPVTLKLLSVVLPPPRLDGHADARAVQKARAFMTEHDPSLRLAEQEFGVSAPVIAAILWIETRYGAYKPRYRALDTLASLAALSHPPLARLEAERTRTLAGQRGYRGWESLDWEVRARTVGERWFGELRSFLQMAERLDWSRPRVRSLKSSWAGALGYGQFLPSTALRHMEAGGSFEAADLWSWHDTVRLVGRHLHEGGFRADADPRSRRDSILHYNRLQAYADVVLRLSSEFQADWESAVASDRNP
jgi:membrane-bound lytic murein transglycosylase B